MYIISHGHYIPSDSIGNEYFQELNGLSPDWILSRTGIHSRSKAGKGENTHTMAIAASKCAIKNLPFTTSEIDLIIGGTYTPYDTLATMAHYVQHHLDIEKCRTITLSSACSSFINAMEVVQTYFISGKAKRALVVISEHNSAYNDETDQTSGHLWGDGAAAFVISSEKEEASIMEIIDLETQGLGHVGKSTEGVTLRPGKDGLRMPHGRDVFIHACNHMAQNTTEILKNNGYTLNDLSFLIPHQANMRIINNISQSLKIDKEKIITNLETLGNTGSASAAIALSQNMDKFDGDDLIAVSVFGGGYSSGVMLLRNRNRR